MSVHSYPIGRDVLCFEPDLNKEIVLYIAKIQSWQGFRMENGKRLPVYEVHFKGWKDKWNREVTEEMLLEMSSFNLMLKKKIDEIVAHVKNPNERKERINSVLNYTAPMNRCDMTESFDWCTIPGVWQGDNDCWKGKRRRSYITKRNKVNVKDSSNHEVGSITSFSSTGDFHKEIEEVSNPENDPLYQVLIPPIVLTPTLIATVEKNLNCPLSDVVQHCPLTVLSILQHYVDIFPKLQVVEFPDDFVPVCGNSEKEKLLREADAQTVEYLYKDITTLDHSHSLCAEVCNGIRICFDAYFISLLLTRTERTKLKFLRLSNVIGVQDVSISPSTSNRVARKRKSMNANSRKLEDSFTDRVTKGEKYVLFPEEAQQKVSNSPSLLYPAVYLLRLFHQLPAILENMNLSICRRAMISRHVHYLINFLEQKRFLLWKS